MTQHDTSSSDFSSTPPGGPGPDPVRPALRRTRGGRKVLGGVAAGLAQWMGIDPILVRVGFVILTLAGGGGILLYLAMWLFLPEEGEPESAGERFLRDNTLLATVLAVFLGLTVVLPVLAWGWWGDGPGFLGILVIVGAVAAVVAVARRDDRREAPLAPPSLATPADPQLSTVPVPPTADTLVLGPTGSTVPVEPTVVAAPTRPRREKSVLGRLTLSAALVVVGVLAGLDVAGVASVDAVTVIASALLVVGVGLLVGTALGRSRSLIAWGVLLVLVLVPVAAVPDGFSTNDGSGSRTYAPTSVLQVKDDYRLGTGELTLDLTAIDPADLADREIAVRVGAGQLDVYLPVGMPAEVTAHAGIGAISFPGDRDNGGIGVDRTWTSPDTTTASGDPVVSPLVLDLDVGLGEIQVHLAPSTHSEVTR